MFSNIFTEVGRVQLMIDLDFQIFQRGHVHNSVSVSGGSDESFDDVRIGEVCML